MTEHAPLFQDAHRMARFFAFMEYPREQIIEYLVTNCDTEGEEAVKLTDRALTRHREREQHEAILAEGYAAAREAELDLDKSNWR